MVGDMENYKVLVSGESKSEEVQDLFFELGCEWETCGNSYNKIVRVGNYIFSTDSNMLNYGFGFGRKEITLQHLKDLVVLNRNSIDDANHESMNGKIKYYLTNTESFEFINGVWVNIDEYVDGVCFKKIEKEVKMKEYIAKVSGNWRLVDSHESIIGQIEVPEGAEEYRANYRFYKNNGELFYCPEGGWTKSIMSEYEPLWQRSPTTLDSKDTTIQNKLKFIEKWLNGEKIQYILGVESDKIQSEKTQWHNFTEGAMQYIKRSDINFREAPKYVTINGIEFKSVERLLKHVKNNFDLEDGE